MAKQELPVDFKDDVLQAEMAGKRKYRIIQNEDGTISLEDVTNYSQIGSNFGAAQMNATNLAVNESFDKNKVIDSLADIVANEATGYAAGALAVRELNGNCIKVVDSKKTTTNGYNYEYSVLSFGDKRYVKLFGNYTIKNATGTSITPFVYNTITNLGLFPVNITTKIKKVLDFSLNCFNPGNGLFLIGGIKKHIATTNAYADVQFLMTNPPQNIGLEWMMVCEIE